MNHSLDNLLQGMAQALRTHVIPATQGEFARGQAYGVIFMLNSLRLRISWSPVFLWQQIALQDELVSALPAFPEGAPSLSVSGARGDDPAALEKKRDEADRAICALIDWLAAHAVDLPQDMVASAEAALSKYLSQQIRFELTTSARPMFREISLGDEAAEGGE